MHGDLRMFLSLLPVSPLQYITRECVCERDSAGYPGRASAPRASSLTARATLGGRLLGQWKQGRDGPPTPGRDGHATPQATPQPPPASCS